MSGDAEMTEALPQRTGGEDRKRKGRGFKGPGAVDIEDRHDGPKFDTLEQDKGLGPAKSVEGWVVFVAGVHEEAGEDHLADAFSEFGNIKNIYLNLDRRTGYVKGYALVEYQTRSEAEEAIKEMDGGELLGQTIHVTWAFAKGPMKKGGRR